MRTTMEIQEKVIDGEGKVSWPNAIPPIPLATHDVAPDTCGNLFDSEGYYEGKSKALALTGTFDGLLSGKTIRECILFDSHDEAPEDRCEDVRKELRAEVILP